jgi:hypothetical protein
LLLAGRGFGKTRSGAECIRDQVIHRRRRFALVAPTAADARDVMVEPRASAWATCTPTYSAMLAGSSWSTRASNPHHRRLSRTPANRQYGPLHQNRLSTVRRLLAGLTLSVPPVRGKSMPV